VPRVAPRCEFKEDWCGNLNGWISTDPTKGDQIFPFRNQTQKPLLIDRAKMVSHQPLVKKKPGTNRYVAGEKAQAENKKPDIA
jgi:hypothetical protein